MATEFWDTEGLCRIEATTAVVRWYTDPAADFHTPHGATALIIWRSPVLVEILAHTAKVPHTQTSMRALLRRLRAAGIEKVVAGRELGRLIPGGVRLPDGSVEIDLLRLSRRGKESEK